MLAAGMAELQQFPDLERLLESAPPEITRFPHYWLRTVAARHPTSDFAADATSTAQSTSIAGKAMASRRMRWVSRVTNSFGNCSRVLQPSPQSQASTIAVTAPV